MDDGPLLLKAVLKSHTKDTGACNALVDYLQEHLPAPGEEVVVRFSFRVRYGGIRVKRGSGATVNPDYLYTITSFHRSRTARGTRMYTIHSSTDDPRLDSCLKKALEIFRS